MDKTASRARRARRTRAKIRELGVHRLTVTRTPKHVYAQVMESDGSRVLASASTLDKEIRAEVGYGGNVDAAKTVGQAVAERANRRCHAGRFRPRRLPFPWSRESTG